VGAGGNGGGGAGGKSTTGVQGTPNTGGGGGSGGGDSANNGAQGGSGIVIIRYSNTYSNATSTTGNPTGPVNTGGYKYYTFTGSGSITF
jgi:hypothetical protein